MDICGCFVAGREVAVLGNIRTLDIDLLDSQLNLTWTVVMEVGTKLAFSVGLGRDDLTALCLGRNRASVDWNRIENVI